MFLIYFLIGQQFALQLKFLNVKLFFSMFLLHFYEHILTDDTQNTKRRRDKSE